MISTNNITVRPDYKGVDVILGFKAKIGRISPRDLSGYVQGQRSQQTRDKALN